MTYVNTVDIQAWVDQSKLPIDNTLLTRADNASLLDQIEGEVFSTLKGTFDTTTWVDPATTPINVRRVIAMRFAAVIWRRQYSEITTDTPSYAQWLEDNAIALLSGIFDGLVDIAQPMSQAGNPSFYPNDASSALDANSDDRSLGGPAFSMGTLW